MAVSETDRDRLKIRLWRESLAHTGSALLCVEGDSMQPLLPRGSWIVIGRTDPELLVPGDIVVLDRGNMLVTHRLVDKFLSKGKLRFAEKGDAEERFRPVEACSILGKVTGIAADGGPAVPIRDPIRRYYYGWYRLRKLISLSFPVFVRRNLWKGILAGAKLLARLVAVARTEKGRQIDRARGR